MTVIKLRQGDFTLRKDDPEADREEIMRQRINSIAQKRTASTTGRDRQTAERSLK